ncbi:MAG: thioredoxin domain-containing protein [Candidatus Micrarchaeia archaeon]
MADEKDSITMSKDTLYGVVIVGLAALLVLSVLTQGFGIVKSPAVQPSAAQPTAAAQPSAAAQPTAAAQPSAVGQLSVDPGKLPVLGQAGAPVTLVEFSDFQCPFCERLYTQALAQIKTNYIDTGKAKLYFRDFPLSFHPNALPAAIAARCANEQGKFWGMHDKLFSNQNSWVSLGDASPAFKGYAADLGLDSSKFNTCLDGKQHAAEINADEAVGQQYGVQGTPGVFIIIPKSKVSPSDLKGAITDGLTLFENQNEYIVFVAGAYPYSAFDAVLKKVAY